MIHEGLLLNPDSVDWTELRKKLDDRSKRHSYEKEILDAGATISSYFSSEQVLALLNQITKSFNERDHVAQFEQVRKLYEYTKHDFGKFNYMTTEEILERDKRVPEHLSFPDIYGMEYRAVMVGEYCVVGGKTGAGKTTFMANLFYEYLKQGKRCVFFTFEQNENVIMKKLYGIFLKDQKDEDVGFFELSKRIANDDAEFRRYTEFVKFVMSLAKIKFASLYSINDIFTFHDLCEEREKRLIPIAFIDYVQIIEKAFNNNIRERLIYLVNRIREIALQNKRVYFLGSQLNDFGEFRESSSIKDGAGFALNVERDENNAGILKLVIKKNRYGACGRI